MKYISIPSTPGSVCAKRAAEKEDVFIVFNDVIWFQNHKDLNL